MFTLLGFITNIHYMFRPIWPSPGVQVVLIKVNATLFLYCDCCSFFSMPVTVHTFSLRVIDGRLYYSIKYDSCLCLFCPCISDVTYSFVG
jgi:hypothetical protein